MWQNIRHTLILLRNILFVVIPILLAAMFMSACSNIDCPLENTVYATYNFYDSSTRAKVSVSDTITVTTAGSDSILYNSGYNVSTIQLPMSYARNIDTLIVKIAGQETTVIDTIFVMHTNEPHFESVDCGTAMFHVVKNVAWTANGISGVSYIDSVVISNPKVNYNDTENFKIYVNIP